MIKKYLSSEFAKNVITLVTGTGIAQAIAFLAAPVLSRFYEPEDFTVFALFSSTAAIASVVATARYELAIPLPKEEKDAKSILRLSLLISLIVAMVTLFGVALYDFFGGKYKSDHFTFWFYLIPISVFATGAYNAFNYWSTRIKTFRMNSAGRIAMAIVTASISILLSYLSFGATGLIVGLVAGQIMAMLVLSFPYLKNRKAFFAGTTHENVKTQAKIHKSFFRVNSPHALLDSIQDNGVVYLLSYFFVDAVTGWYSFAFRILKAPVGLIGSAFYQVFYQKLSNAKNEGADLRPLVRSMYLRMFLIGFPGFLVLFLFTPELFSFIFGAKWHEAGVIARILIPWLFLNFIVSPVSCITLVCNRQPQAFLFTIGDSMVRLAALIIGGLRHDYILSFTIISAFCSSLMIFALWWYYSLAKRNSNIPNGIQ
ncbi:MAG: oligosaccharide flippase family protein [Bacteroidetes bacterium]|nr:oligosaccharide flippase family protein [Bacteroidota bacterium]